MKHTAGYTVDAMCFATFDAPKGASQEKLIELAMDAYPGPSVCCHCSPHIELADMLDLVCVDDESIETESERGLRELKEEIARLQAREAEARRVIEGLLRSIPPRLGSVEVAESVGLAMEWLWKEKVAR